MTDQLKHCCTHMDRYTVTKEEDFIIEYEPDMRTYNFRLYDKGEYIGVRQRLFYCPWCGKKLPKTLGDEWEEVLQNEYGMAINDVFDKTGRWDELKVPEELRTDEWWKKRGL